MVSGLSSSTLLLSHVAESRWRGEAVTLTGGMRTSEPSTSTHTLNVARLIVRFPCASVSMLSVTRLSETYRARTLFRAGTVVDGEEGGVVAVVDDALDLVGVDLLLEKYQTSPTTRSRPTTPAAIHVVEMPVLGGVSRDDDI